MISYRRYNSIYTCSHNPLKGRAIPQHHTYEENIDVSTDVAAVFKLSFHPSQEQTEDCLLHVVMPMNARGQ